MIDSNVDWTNKELNKTDKIQNYYLKKKKRALIKLEKRKLKNEISEINSLDKDVSDRKKKLTTTKIIMYFILINCSVIEIYSMWVMYMLQDLSALYSLIGAVVSESISYAIYCAKSFNDTKSEVSAKLERDKFEAGLSDDELEKLNNITPDDIPADDDHSGDIPKDADPVDESSFNGDDVESDDSTDDTKEE